MVVDTVVVGGEDFACSPERTSSTAIVAASRNAAGAAYRLTSARQPRSNFLPAGDGPDFALQPRCLVRGGGAPVLPVRAERVEDAAGDAHDRAGRAAREGAGEVGRRRALPA